MTEGYDKIPKNYMKTGNGHLRSERVQFIALVSHRLWIRRLGGCPRTEKITRQHRQYQYE